jgi:hypothetical protein
MSIGFLINKKFGFILLLMTSFITACWLVWPLSMCSVREGKAPEWFNVIVYYPPSSVSMEKFHQLKELPNDKTFLIPTEKINLFNQKLAQQYTGHGGTWSFEVLSQHQDKQYIHVIATGDDDIIESWYWASNTQIIPVQYRWLNPGAIFIVLPLTIFLTTFGLFFYRFIGRKIIFLWI